MDALRSLVSSANRRLPLDDENDDSLPSIQSLLDATNSLFRRGPTVSVAQKRKKRGRKLFSQVTLTVMALDRLYSKVPPLPWLQRLNKNGLGCRDIILTRSASRMSLEDKLVETFAKLGHRFSMYKSTRNRVLLGPLEFQTVAELIDEIKKGKLYIVPARPVDLESADGDAFEIHMSTWPSSSSCSEDEFQRTPPCPWPTSTTTQPSVTATTSRPVSATSTTTQPSVTATTSRPVSTNTTSVSGMCQGILGVVHNDGVSLPDFRALQDAEYQASLLADIEKDRLRREEQVNERLRREEQENQKKTEEEEANAREERWSELREYRKWQLLDEPVDGFPIKVQTCTGSSIRRFLAVSSLEDLSNFVGSLEGSSEHFSVHFPNMQPINLTGRGTLSDEGICAASLLHVRWFKEPEKELTSLSPPVAETTQIPVAEPTPALLTEPTPALLAEPTPAQLAETTPAPLLETTQIPVAEPTPAPLVETTPAPLAEPTPAPLAETTQIPVAEPTPAPLVEPTPAPLAETTQIPVAEHTPAPLAETIPVAEPTPAPLAETTQIPVAEPTPAPLAETIPVAEPTPAPLAETIPVAEPTPAPLVEPTPAPLAEPTPAPLVEPTPAPLAETTQIPVAEPTPAPLVEPTPAPLAETIPVAEPTPVPLVEPTPSPLAETTQTPQEAEEVSRSEDTPPIANRRPRREAATAAMLRVHEWVEEMDLNTSLNLNVSISSPHINSPSIVEILDSEDEAFRDLLENEDEVLDTEDIALLRAVMQNETPMSSAKPDVPTLTLSDCLEIFKCKKDETKKQEMIISRRKVLATTFRALRRNFDATCSIYVKFSGEMGLDYGGPSREFFRLVIQELKNSALFEGSFFSHDIQRLQSRDYGLAGKLVAMSILHDGPTIQIQSHLMRLMLGQDADFSDFGMDIIPDEDWRAILVLLQQADTVRLRETFLHQHGSWLVGQGIVAAWDASTFDPEVMCKMLVKQYIFYRTMPEINQFTQGMDEVLGLWTMLTKNQSCALELFCRKPKPLTKTTFMALLINIWSEVGSNHRNEEEDTIYSWEIFLQDIEDKAIDATLEEILVFVSGADAVPACGFTSLIEIQFFSRDDGRLPSSSTCALILNLPRGVGDPDEFRSIMLKALKESSGFGKI